MPLFGSRMSSTIRCLPEMLSSQRVKSVDGLCAAAAVATGRAVPTPIAAMAAARPMNSRRSRCCLVSSILESSISTSSCVDLHCSVLLHVAAAMLDWDQWKILCAGHVRQAYGCRIGADRRRLTRIFGIAVLHRHTAPEDAHWPRQSYESGAFEEFSRHEVRICGN